MPRLPDAAAQIGGQRDVVTSEARAAEGTDVAGCCHAGGEHPPRARCPREMHDKAHLLRAAGLS
jgi:hypothetical protein